ncbi:replication initiation protein [Proteocatella sphenisci]|uniref:replication initiation protein n=1 Tax=Proteocatella sphenisci TaxID=181070 RepID=UPI0004BA2882|nr:replication initiation protein [Proteocatella sphenisci]
MSEIVKYHNDLNTLQMSGFTEKEIDIFFSICYKLKNKGNNNVNMTYREIKELSNYKHRSISKIHDSIDSTFKKILGLSIKIEDENSIARFVLFTDYVINKDKQYIDLQVHEKFKYLLNDFMSNYTKFELKEFVSLKSIYSKNLYKILKQYKSTGWYEVSLDQFRYLLDVPKTYDTNNFNKRVLRPIMDELPGYFKGLNIEKLKKGRNIDRLRFTWALDSSKKVEVLPNNKVKDQVIQNKVAAVKAAITTLSDSEIEVLLDAADVGIILEKYYTLAIGKNIENLTGFLLSSIKNDWKNSSHVSKEFKKENKHDKPMDELEAKFQKKLFERISKKQSDQGKENNNDN